VVGVGLVGGGVLCWGCCVIGDGVRMIWWFFGVCVWVSFVLVVVLFVGYF
jgi:hypothetical protein